MKRYIAGLAALLMLGIYGCSGGGGSLTTDSSNTSQTEKASVTFKVDFAPGSLDIQSAALQSDITMVEIYYAAGCKNVTPDFMSDPDGEWFGDYRLRLDNCSLGGTIALTRDSNTYTIKDIPVGPAYISAKIMKDNGTVVDEVIAQGKLNSGSNKVYLPVLRGMWQLDSAVNLSLVNNLANSGISGINDNLSFNISQLNALQLFGRYERMDNTTLGYCDYHGINYRPNYVKVIRNSTLQFDNNTPFFANYYQGSFYSYGCGIPGLSYTYDNRSFLFYNNKNTDYYYYNEAFGKNYGIDGWYAQVLQFGGGDKNANLLDVGIHYQEEKVLDNGSYFTSVVELSTLPIDPFLETPDYKALTYYDYTAGKLTGYFVEHAQTVVYKCSILEKIWDNNTYQYIDVAKYDLSSCNVLPNVTTSFKKSTKSIATALVSKSLSKAIKKSSIVVDGTITNFSMNDSMELYWGNFCYDNTTKTASIVQDYWDNSSNSWITPCDKQLVYGQLQATGTLTGKYRVVPFTATKQTTFNPANYVAGAQIVDWIWKGARPTTTPQ